MAVADLSVVKTSSPNPGGIGQPLYYTIIVSNHGPETATSVMLEDTIPTGVCLTDITIEQGTYSYENGTITWNVGTLQADDTKTMTISVIPQTAGTMGNTATVYHNNEGDEDPNPDNNTVFSEVTVTPGVDLVILKESYPRETSIGDTLTYLITVLNSGPSPANNVSVTDNLPAGVVVESITTSKGICQTTGNTLNCDLTSLDANERWNIRIDVIPSTEGEIVNTAEVTSDEPDSNPENNTDRVTTIVGPTADLSISKAVSTTEVVVDNTLTYTLLVTNHGPSDATNVVVIDTLPSNVSVSSITASQGTCYQIGDVITCNLGDLEKDQTIPIDIDIKPNEPGFIINSADVSANEVDPNKCNNTTTAGVYVKKTVGTDLSVIKSHNPEPVAICTPVKYTITVANNGPTSATGIILSDKAPSSLEILSIASSQGMCCVCNEKDCHSPSKHYHYGDRDHNCKRMNDCHGDSHITCQLGALTSGASATVEICARPLLLGSISNTAIVTSNQEDLDPSNNEVTDTLTVVTLEEQIELIINFIYELITLCLIEEKNGDVLVNILKDAKTALCCGDTCKFERKLGYFIKKVERYIERGLIPEEQGCYLEKTVRLIKKEYKCRGCRGADIHE